MNLRMLRSAAITTLIALLILTGLPQSAAAQGAHRRPRIVGTTTQVADALRMLVGDQAEVIGLLKAGIDPHLYQPTEADITAMNQADLVVYNGLNLEGQFGQVLEALGQRNIRTYAISDPVKREGFVLDSLDPEKGVGAPDPHFWFDPRNWSLAVTGLAQVLGETDPPNTRFFADNAMLYSQQLERLYQWGVQAMTDKTIPEDKRVLVTSHDAFQYFGSAFGWKVRGIQGISTQAEASVTDVQAVADEVVAAKVSVIFVETSVSPRTIEAVIEAAKNKGAEIKIGIRGLYSDAMGNPEEFGGTYIGMIAHNIHTILQSFGYAVPAWPEGLKPAPTEALLAGK